MVADLERVRAWDSAHIDVSAVPVYGARVFACRRCAGGPYTGSKLGRGPRLAASAS